MEKKQHRVKVVVRVRPSKDAATIIHVCVTFRASVIFRPQQCSRYGEEAAPCEGGGASAAVPGRGGQQLGTRAGGRQDTGDH